MFRRVSALAWAVAVAALAAAVLVPSWSVAGTHDRCRLPMFGPGSAYHPKIAPGNFGPRVTNPWFPLKVGRTLVYTGIKDEHRALNIVTITGRTKHIDGVVTRVVEDRLYLDNVLRERTSDYYAQDRCGNVWYFGEDTAELDMYGHTVTIEGTFHAGIDGAQPGVVMQAKPEVGRVFRQEWYQSHAEDRFWGLNRNASIRVPYGTFPQALRTAEATDLEPEVLDNKYYARGIGQVAELSVRGPAESLRLVEIIS